MRDTDRLNLARERLTACQLALRVLTDKIWSGQGCAHQADALADAFQELEDAVGAPVTPAALFTEGGAL